MGLPMESVRFVTPAWGSLHAWNCAHEKLEDYLRALRVESRLLRAQLTERILAAVVREAPAQGFPDAELESHVIAVCRRELTAWLGNVLGTPPAGGAAPVEALDGRVALLIADGLQRWPAAFMGLEACPPDLQRAVRDSVLRAGPELAISHMVPREMEIGFIPELASETIATFARWPALKLAFVWSLYLLALALLFIHTR